MNIRYLNLQACLYLRNLQDRFLPFDQVQGALDREMGAPGLPVKIRYLALIEEGTIIVSGVVDAG